MLPLQELSNERLEYLGDSAIGHSVGYYLFMRYPGMFTCYSSFWSYLWLECCTQIFLVYLKKSLYFQCWDTIMKSICVFDYILIS